MPRTTRKPLFVKDLVRMKVGDTFVAWWAKDDDPNDVRIDFEKYTISLIEFKKTKRGEEWGITSVDKYEDTLDLDIRNEPNILEHSSISLASRGLCYLYRSK